MTFGCGVKQRQLTRRHDSDVDLAILPSDKAGQGPDGKTGWRQQAGMREEPVGFRVSEDEQPGFE